MIKIYLLEILKNDFSNIKNITEKEWLELVNLSILQNVSNVLFFSLKKNKLDYLIPKSSFELLKTMYEKTIFRNIKIKSEIKNINKIFIENNIDVIFLKGSHLINHIYENLSLRYVQDIDLLIDKESSKKAFELIKNLSYTVKNILDKYDYDFSFSHHLPKMRKDDIFLEIHYNILSAKNLDIKDFSKHFVELDDNIKYFDNTHLFIHLCIHISYQDLFCIDLRHYYDIFYMLKNKKVNIEEVILKAKNYNLQKGVLFVIKILEKLFNINLNINNYLSDFIITDEDINKAINLMWLYNKTNIKEYIEYKKSPKIYKDFKNNSFLQKTFIFIKKVFIAKNILIHKYKINSSFWYLYYFIRFIDLIKNHYKSINNNKYYQDKLNLLMKIE